MNLQLTVLKPAAPRLWKEAPKRRASRHLETYLMNNNAHGIAMAEIIAIPGSQTDELQARWAILSLPVDNTEPKPSASVLAEFPRFRRDVRHGDRLINDADRMALDCAITVSSSGMSSSLTNEEHRVLEGVI